MGTCAPHSRRDTFTPLTKTPKEILEMESVNVPPSPPLIGTLEKQNLNKFCDYHGDRGHNTNDCYHLKKQIEYVVASEKLAHLVKDIRQGNQRNRGQGRGIFVDGGSSSKIMYEHCFKSFDVGTKSKLRKTNAPLVGFLGEIYHPLGLIDVRVTMEPGRNKTVLLEFAIVKCCSPYNIIPVRTRIRSLRAVGSTIHSMIKFPTANGVATMKTSREALWEFREIEEMHSSWKET
ncbi:hypothetical protein Tco_0500367 [Tanacetum coccineum]